MYGTNFSVVGKIIMTKAELGDLIYLLELGREYISEAILIHDRELGRTTMKNEGTAKRMENDLASYDAYLTKIHQKFHKK